MFLQSYPGVPYSSLDFNDYRCEIDYGDAWSIRNCALLGMSDLNQGKVFHIMKSSPMMRSLENGRDIKKNIKLQEYVREKIAEYANDLLRMGVKGFRFDASKHMYPGDLEAIVVRQPWILLKNLYKKKLSANFLLMEKFYFVTLKAKFENTIDGNRPLVYHEVIDYRSEPVRMEEYFNAGKVTEFRYGSQMTCIRGRDWHCLDGFAKVRMGIITFFCIFMTLNITCFTCEELHRRFARDRLLGQPRHAETQRRGHLLGGLQLQIGLRVNKDL
jgi:alpha-amylase